MNTLKDFSLKEMLGNKNNILLFTNCFDASTIFKTTAMKCNYTLYTIQDFEFQIMRL